MIADRKTAVELARFATEFAIPDMPRAPELIEGEDVPDELVRMVHDHYEIRRVIAH